MAGGEGKALLNMHLHPAAIFHSTAGTQPGALQTPTFPPQKAPGLRDSLRQQEEAFWKTPFLPQTSSASAPRAPPSSQTCGPPPRPAEVSTASGGSCLTLQPWVCSPGDASLSSGDIPGCHPVSRDFPVFSPGGPGRATASQAPPVLEAVTPSTRAPGVRVYAH